MNSRDGHKRRTSAGKNIETRQRLIEIENVSHNFEVKSLTIADLLRNMEIFLKNRAFYTTP